MIVASSGGSEWSVGGLEVGTCAQHVNGKTYFAWQGVNYGIYVAVLDDGVWSLPVLAAVSPLTLDSHGSPALLVDAAGYLHIVYGSHDSPQKYIKSSAPYSVSGWNVQPDIAPQATYPRLFQFSDGRIEVWYRAGGHLADWGYKSSANGGISWSSFVPVLDAGDTPRNAFYLSVTQHGDDLHLGWCWKDDTNQRLAPGPEFTHRYSQYYLMRDSAGVYRRADGVPQSVPQIASQHNSNNLFVHPMPTVPERTATPAVAVSADSTPAVLYAYGDTTSFAWTFAKWNGSAWVRSTITTTDYQLDGCQLESPSPGVWVAHVISRGTAGLSGNRDTPPLADRGGFIERWRSTDDGATWAKEGAVEDMIYGDLQLVLNGQDDCYLVTHEYKAIGDFSGRIMSLPKAYGGSSPTWKPSWANAPWGNANFRIRDGIVEELS